MSAQLESFNHAYLKRDFKWNLMQSGWIEAELGCIENLERKEIITTIVEQFKVIAIPMQNTTSLPMTTLKPQTAKPD